MQTWVPTGNMNVQRSGHSATAFHNHQVLVVGGSDGSTYLDSAELYDPATGVWTFRGSMFYVRAGHTATLLPNGKVLVVGGTANTNTELYDPATGEWFATGRLNAARPSSHAATLLEDGRVLVVGGFDPSVPFPHCFLSSAEIYDPETQAWTATGDMNFGRYGLTVTALFSGKALVVGGSNGLTGIQSTAELWDPGSGAWSLTSEPFTGRFGHSASLLQDGNVLVAGGLFVAVSPNPHDESLDTCEAYDPTTENWYAVGKLQIARRYHTAALLHDGRVLVVGGVEHDLYSGGYLDLNSAELYDPRTFAWTVTTNLIMARSGHTESVLWVRPIASSLQQASTVLVAGGGSTLNSAELYSIEPAPPVDRQ